MDFVSDAWTPMIKLSEKYFLGTFPYLKTNNPKFGFISIGFTFDLKSKIANSKIFEYSEPYKKKSFCFAHSHYYSYKGLDNKSIVVSFSADENLYLIDLGGKLIRKNNTLSDFFDLDLQSMKKEGQIAMEKYHLENPSFGKILSDPYRKIYYRFAFQKYEGNEKVPTAMLPSYKPLSVIILNDKLEKIGETKLPENNHFVYIAFVGKKKLYISNAHPNNPQNEENKLSFTCYELIKI